MAGPRQHSPRRDSQRQPSVEVGHEQAQRPWPASAGAIETRYATLLYAVNLMNWLGLPDLDDSAPGWGTVEALGAWLLGAARNDPDPIWPALAELDGREPDTRTPTRLGPLTRRARRLLDRRRLARDVFAQPGLVVVGRTHVDVVLTLDQINLAARTSGLDQDPGWVPTLGRIVAFHFTGSR
jgi:hypothetical protein